MTVITTASVNTATATSILNFHVSKKSFKAGSSRICKKARTAVPSALKTHLLRRSSAKVLPQRTAANGTAEAYI